MVLELQAANQQLRQQVEDEVARGSKGLDASLRGDGLAMTEKLPEDPLEDSVRSVPLDMGEGPDVVIEQENLGPGAREGGGEWPSPSTPARGPSPGAIRQQDEEDAAANRKNATPAPEAGDGEHGPGTPPGTSS
jgi:hypothetical protein